MLDSFFCCRFCRLMVKTPKFGISEWLVIFIALAIAVIGFLMFRDEALSEEAQRMLTPYPADFSADNAYLHLVGLAAPAGSDAPAHARRWIEVFSVPRGPDDIKRQLAAFENKLPLVGDRDELCAPHKAACLPQLPEKAELWRQRLQDNRELMARFRTLSGLARFNEFYVPDNTASPLPEFKPLTQAHLLELGEIALDAQAGRLEEALSSLEARLVVDRRMLNGAQTMIGNLIANEMLRNDYRLLGEIVTANRGRLAPWRARLLKMSRPLEIEDCKSAVIRGVSGEAHTLTSLFLHMPDSVASEKKDATQVSQRLLFRAGFRANATTNLLAARFERSRQRLAAFDPQHPELFRTAEEEDRQAFRDSVFSLQRGVNPLGQIFLSVADLEWSDYALRFTDTALISRITRLQVLAALDGKDGIPELLAKPEFFDPYTGQPLPWNAAKRLLSVDFKGKQSGKLPSHIELPL